MTDQPGPFQLWTTLAFPDRSSIAQGFTVESHSGDIYATQDFDGSHMTITRFEPIAGEFVAMDQMSVHGGGHGDLTFDVEVVDGEVCPSFADHSGRLWRVPFQPGKDVTLPGKPVAAGWRMPIRGYDGTVLVRRTVRREIRPHHFYGPKQRSNAMVGQGTRAALADATERLFRVKDYGWIQGYAYHLGILYTLRGAPRVANGWLYPGAEVMPYVERRLAIAEPRGMLLEPWKVDTLGWENGEPVDGKVEPEGMCVALVDGTPTLLVGISTGHRFNASYSLQIWARAL
jgi:hypothetical protein